MKNVHLRQEVTQVSQLNRLCFSFWDSPSSFFVAPSSPLLLFPRKSENSNKMHTACVTKAKYISRELSDIHTRICEDDVFFTWWEVFLFDNMFSRFLPNSSKSESSSSVSSSSVDRTSLDPNILRKKNPLNSPLNQTPFVFYCLLIKYWQHSNNQRLIHLQWITHLFCKSKILWHSSLYLSWCSATENLLPLANLLMPKIQIWFVRVCSYFGRIEIISKE